tara:strand:+ start:7625 stop:8791 length:1167 start_codon:yes stop_codon:yes gene_type:complete
MKKLIKMIIFSRERFLIYRLYKLVFFSFKNKLVFKDFFDLFFLTIKNSPKKKTEISKESYYKFFRGLHLNNLKSISNLPIVWGDIYGVGVRLEHLMNIKIIDNNYSKLLALLLGCFLEYRGKYTNNHLLMNLLILYRYFNEIGDDENKIRILKKIYHAEKFLFQDNYFLENSSHYLFLLGYRLQHVKMLSNINYINALKYFNILKSYYNKISWLGDISPDPLEIRYNNLKINKMHFYNYGFMIFVASPNYFIKLSISNSRLRHGHNDIGQLIFCSKDLNIYDRGIDDLSNTNLKTKNQHQNWNFGSLKNNIISEEKIFINFENVTLYCFKNKIKLKYKVNVPDINIYTDLNSGHFDKLKVDLASKEKKVYCMPLNKLKYIKKNLLCVE